MSSATAHSPALDSAQSSQRYFLLRRLHSLTGILFGLYIVVHLVINATLAQGGTVFQEQVNKIHSLPFLLAIEWIFIFGPLIFHTIYGIWVTFAGVPNVQNYPYGKNIFYTLQRVTAMLLIGFVIFHILGMKGFFGTALTFEPHGGATSSTVRHINAHWAIAWIIYPVGVAAACFHLANGFWTGAITWGLTISKASQRRFGWICVGLFLLTFGCGMLAWFTAVRLNGTNFAAVVAH